MRTLFFALLTLAVSTPQLTAQECRAFFPFEEGVTLGYTFYDKKQKEEGAQTLKITSVKANDDGSVEATVDYSFVDKKGKDSMAGTYTVACKEDVYYMDMSAMIPPQMMESFKSMEVTVEGSQLEFPSGLRVGQTLPDASTTIKAATNGMNLMSMTINVTNRKVEAEENLTTPAGSFNTFKLSSNTDSKMMMIKTNIRSLQWIAENVGTVRTETYDKNGNLESTMVLTKFEK